MNQILRYYLNCVHSNSFLIADNTQSNNLKAEKTKNISEKKERIAYPTITILLAIVNAIRWLGANISYKKQC